MFPKLEIHNFELNFGSIRDGKDLFDSRVFGILLWVIRRLELTLSSSLYQTRWWNFFPCSKKTLPVLHVVAFKSVPRPRNLILGVPQGVNETKCVDVQALHMQDWQGALGLFGEVRDGLVPSLVLRQRTLKLTES